MIPHQSPFWIKARLGARESVAFNVMCLMIPLIAKLRL